MLQLITWENESSLYLTFILFRQKYFGEIYIRLLCTYYFFLIFADPVPTFIFCLITIHIVVDKFKCTNSSIAAIEACVIEDRVKWFFELIWLDYYYYYYYYFHNQSPPFCRNYIIYYTPNSIWWIFSG